MKRGRRERRTLLRKTVMTAVNVRKLADTVQNVNLSISTGCVHPIPNEVCECFCVRVCV